MLSLARVMVNSVSSDLKYMKQIREKRLKARLAEQFIRFLQRV